MLSIQDTVAIHWLCVHLYVSVVHLQSMFKMFTGVLEFGGQAAGGSSQLCGQELSVLDMLKPCSCIQAIISRLQLVQNC